MQATHLPCSGGTWCSGRLAGKVWSQVALVFVAQRKEVVEKDYSSRLELVVPSLRRCQ
jgi:hypothetical protein